MYISKIKKIAPETADAAAKRLVIAITLRREEAETDEHQHKPEDHNHEQRARK